MKIKCGKHRQGTGLDSWLYSLHTQPGVRHTAGVQMSVNQLTEMTCSTVSQLGGGH